MIDALSTMGRRYLALWAPFLPTERLRRRASLSASNERGDAPRVLVEKAGNALRLAAVDPCALRLGLAVGMTLADARARIPDLIESDHEPAADRAFLERLADACERYTPLVAVDAPDGLMLDIAGCAHLFGGEDALRADVIARFARGGVSLRAAIASTPDTARALARFSETAIVESGEEAAAVRNLSILALGLVPETATALIRAGLKTIGALADRPRAPLAARFGEDIVGRLHRILGFEDLRLTPRRALPECIVERRFAEPIARNSDVEGALLSLMEKIVAMLEQRGEGGRAFEASFFRADGAVRRLLVETGQPSRDPRLVMRLYRERLDALADPIDPGFGFDLIRVSAPETEPLRAAQSSLDGRRGEEEEVAELVNRLVARLGRDRVLRFIARDTHDPDREAALVPAIDAPVGLPWEKPAPGDPPARPLHLFDPPQPIETMAAVPDGPPVRFHWRRIAHEIARAEGPERIAPEWWSNADAPTRDYYRVEDTNGLRFWLYRDGLYESGAAPRWYLRGLFA